MYQLGWTCAADQWNPITVVPSNALEMQDWTLIHLQFFIGCLSGCKILGPESEKYSQRQKKQKRSEWDRRLRGWRNKAIEREGERGGMLCMIWRWTWHSDPLLQEEWVSICRRIPPRMKMTHRPALFSSQRERGWETYWRDGERERCNIIPLINHIAHTQEQDVHHFICKRWWTCG